jgi:glc operon protein GlcG
LTAGKVPVAVKLPSRKVLTLELAKRIADVCREYAHERGHTIDLAIVDPGGYLVYFEREDGVSVGTVDVAIRKAQSAARFGIPSKSFELTVNDGLYGLVGLPGMAAFEGAVPLKVEGDLLGAIAISGVTKEFDGECAQFGADSIASILADG